MWNRTVGFAARVALAAATGLVHPPSAAQGQTPPAVNEARVPLSDYTFNLCRRNCSSSRDLCVAVCNDRNSDAADSRQCRNECAAEYSTCRDDCEFER